jgi:hypothetical protein
MKAPKIVCALGAIILIIPIATLIDIFKSEDFYPEKGSLTYYIGISSLIRNTPIIENIGRPVYYGSVGDGSKPPQSKVTYETKSISTQDIENKIEFFLNSNGFKNDNQKKTPWNLFDPEEKKLLRQHDYKSVSDESASLLIYEAIKTKNLQIEITHYE